MADHELSPQPQHPDPRDDPRWDRLVENGIFSPDMAETAITGLRRQAAEPHHRPRLTGTRRPVRETRNGDSELDGADEDGILPYHKPYISLDPEAESAQQAVNAAGRAGANKELAVVDYDIVGRVAERTGYTRSTLDAMRLNNPDAFGRLSRRSNRL